MIEIKNRWTGKTICQGETWAEAFAAAPRNEKSAANLSAANLSDADLRRADLRRANLSAANLSAAYLSAANLSAANLLNVLGYEIPIVTDLDAKILAAVEAPGNALDMSDWHRCATTHCRAGWAIELAGEAGKALEAKLGPSAAGALIYLASTGRGQVPDFMASNEAALEDLRRCAALPPVAPSED